LWRSHRELGPPQKSASWQGPPVSPNRRYGILRPDVERAELLAWLPASTRMAGDEKTNLKSSIERFACIRQCRCQASIQLHLDAGRFQFRFCKFQGFRSASNPNTCAPR
jgi:hypothetical protein